MELNEYIKAIGYSIAPGKTYIRYYNSLRAMFWKWIPEVKTDKDKLLTKMWGHEVQYKMLSACPENMK